MARAYGSFSIYTNSITLKIAKKTTPVDIVYRDEEISLEIDWKSYEEN